MLFCTLLFLVAQNPPQAPIALLNDGTRVQVLQEVELGSFFVRTPFGVLRSQGQQVVGLADSAKEVALLEPLHDLNFPLWVRRLKERGLLERLLKEPLDPTNRPLLFSALRDWGQRLNPLPPDFPQQERVAALWQRILQAQGAERALLVGALEMAVSQASSQPKNRIGLRDWHQAMASKEIGVRWAAARLALLQQEAAMEISLLDSSLEDPTFWVARTSGQALLATDPRGTLHRWSYELLTERKRFTQNRAALLLGELGRAYPELAQSVAESLRTYASNYSKGSCQGSTSILSLALSTTENSVLEIHSPSPLEQLALADILQRVAAPTRDSKSGLPRNLQANPNPVAEKSVSERSEAWRKYFVGR